MTRFTDGPAAGKSLNLKASPRFLRVTTTSKGGLDALDQPTDMPRSNETCHAYRLERIERLNALVCVRGKGGHSFSSIAHYRLNEIQPLQGVMESSMDWAAWTREQSLILLCDPKGGRKCPWFRPGELVYVCGYPNGLKTGVVKDTLVNNVREFDALRKLWPDCPVSIGVHFKPPHGQPHVLVVGKGANDCADLPECAVADWWMSVFRVEDHEAAQRRHDAILRNHESPFDQFDTIHEVIP